MNNEQRIKRDLRRLIGASGFVVVVLLTIIMFSPLASKQYDDVGMARGIGSYWEIDSLMMKKDYHEALRMVDAMIAEKEEGLPRFAFFDRYLSLMIKKDYQGALILVDAMIAEKEEGLPRFAFFDRYLSKDERYDAALARVAISQLKRKRSEILKTLNDVKAGGK